MLIGLRQFVIVPTISTALLRGRLLSRILEGSLCSLCEGVFDVRTSGYQKKPSGDGNDQIGYQPNEGQNHNAHDASGAVVNKGVRSHFGCLFLVNRFFRKYQQLKLDQDSKSHRASEGPAIKSG